MKYQCSFCQDNTDKIDFGWGYAKLVTPSYGVIEVTFCPKHRLEAEEKLDVAFKLPQAYPKSTSHQKQETK